jgi:hypothetical protein
MFLLGLVIGIPVGVIFHAQIFKASIQAAKKAKQAATNIGEEIKKHQ